MTPLMVQRRHKITKSFRANCDAPTHSPRPGHIDFIDVNDQLLTRPVHAARSNLEMMCIPMNVLAATLRHGPAFTPFAIQSHIQSAKVIWICHPTL